MNRRSFLKALGLAPVAAVGVAKAAEEVPTPVPEPEVSLPLYSDFDHPVVQGVPLRSCFNVYVTTVGDNTVLVPEWAQLMELQPEGAGVLCNGFAVPDGQVVIITGPFPPSITVQATVPTHLQIIFREASHTLYTYDTCDHLIPYGP